MKKITAIASGLVLASGMAFAGEGGDKTANFEELDQNQDGVITQSEASQNQELVAQFQQADTNQDGQLTQSEFEAVKSEIEEAE